MVDDINSRLEPKEENLSELEQTLSKREHREKQKAEKKRKIEKGSKIYLWDHIYSLTG